MPPPRMAKRRRFMNRKCSCFSRCLCGSQHGGTVRDPAFYPHFFSGLVPSPWHPPWHCKYRPCSMCCRQRSRSVSWDCCTRRTGVKRTVPLTPISASFGLKHVSGSTYKMWARISNPTGTTVSATLALYDVSYNYITSVNKTSSNTTISLDKNITLSSGTYYLRLNYTADGANYSFEKTYTI